MRTLSISRILLYLFLTAAALLYLLPIYVMLVTSLKPFDQVSLESMWNLPDAVSFSGYQIAF
ncbi:MAG: carbohydrate ABC transporter permease, partial [Thermicanus sp.]|nr:carbohydrate ABC transporter permease [Thermicanus sp.]